MLSTKGSLFPRSWQGLLLGAWLLVGCSGGSPTGSGKATDTPQPQKWRFNTYQSPTVYLDDSVAVDKLTPGQSVTIDGLVALWDETLRVGEKVRYVRLISFRKTAAPPGQKYFFECALPEGSAGFEGLRLEHVARIQGVVEKQDSVVLATPVPRIFLRDCKLVSVANDTIPPPGPVLEAIKSLQGAWRVSRVEGGEATEQYRASEIRFADCSMTWAAPPDSKTGWIKVFGIRVDPGTTPKQMNLYQLGYHMIPAVYEQQGDSLRLCLQLPLDELRENAVRPRILVPGSDGEVVLVAERLKK
jgi:uncharacterized protein (TIGR03067 family)